MRPIRTTFQTLAGATVVAVLATLTATPAIASVDESRPVDRPAQSAADTAHQTSTGMLAAAAGYLGTTPEKADDFFQRQNADLDALDRLNRLTTETDGAFFSNGEATINVTSARAAGLARQLGLTPRYAVRGKRALDALGAQVSKLAGGSKHARDVAAQQLVVYLESTPDNQEARSKLASLPGVRVEAIGKGVAQPAAALHYAGRGMRVYYSSTGQYAGSCTQGFGGTLGGARVMMTVGHCVEDVGTVRNEDLGQAYLGWRIYGAYNTGHLSSDVGIIQLSALADSYTNIDTHLGTHVVQGWHSPVAGMTICKSGATTGWTCGDVVGEHTNVAYEGNTTVRDVWSMTACVRSGDSGGPIISGDYAIGLVSATEPGHTATACPINSGRASATSSDFNHSALFVSIAHLSASYPGLVIRHS